LPQGAAQLFASPIAYAVMGFVRAHLRSGLLFGDAEFVNFAFRLADERAVPMSVNEYIIAPLLALPDGILFLIP